MDGSLDASFTQGTAWGRSVRSIAFQSHGNILIGGNFTPVAGVLRPRVARLFGDVVAPSLSMEWSNGVVSVSWPSAATGFILQQDTNLNTNPWTTPSETITDNGTTKTISVSSTMGSRFSDCSNRKPRCQTAAIATQVSRMNSSFMRAQHDPAQIGNALSER